MSILGFKNEKIKKSENIFEKQKHYTKKIFKKFHNKIKNNIFQNIKYQFNLKLLILPLYTKRFKTQNLKQV